MNQIAKRVELLAAPAASALGLELWDVEYVREAGQWYLRIYIDKDGGVSLDDCEALSRALDPILDAEDPIPDSYIFEVSSAGAERVLRRPGDFARFLGSAVEVKLYKALEGSKTWQGTLAGYDGTAGVRISTPGGDKTFPPETVAQVRLRIEL